MSVALLRETKSEESWKKKGVGKREVDRSPKFIHIQPEACASPYVMPSKGVKKGKKKRRETSSISFPK